MIGQILNSPEIALERSNITGNVNNVFASVMVKQGFMNNSNSSQHCTIVVDGGMSFIIYNVRVSFGKKVLEFVLRDIDEAQTAYQDSIYSGFASGIAHMSTDALTFDIGNIPPKTAFNAIIECSFAASLSSNESIKFSLPFIKKYAGKPLTCSINVSMTNPIREIDNLCGLKFERTSATSGIISAYSAIYPKEQLCPVIRFDGKVENMAVCSRIGGETFIGISAVPKFDESQSNKEVKSDIVVVIDCSGSMSGNKIKCAISALKSFIRGLKSGSYLNIVRFGSNYEILFEKSIEINQKNIDIALEKVDAIQSDLGMTCLLKPLTDIFSWKVRKGYVRQVFIITDGQVDQESECLTLVSKHRNSTRLFVAGIGDDVNSRFIQEFAKTSLGGAEFVKSSDEAGSAIMNLFRNAMIRAIPDIQIHVEGTEAIEIAPFPIPPLFAGSLTNILVRIPSKSVSEEMTVEDIPEGDEPSILITGAENYESFIVSSCAGTKNPIRLDKMYGFFNIRDIEESIALVPDRAGQERLRRVVVEQSSRFGVVSQFTALWGVGTGTSQRAGGQVGPQWGVGQQCFNSRQERGQERFRALSRLSGSRFVAPQKPIETKRNHRNWLKYLLIIISIIVVILAILLKLVY